MNTPASLCWVPSRVPCPMPRGRPRSRANCWNPPNGSRSWGRLHSMDEEDPLTWPPHVQLYGWAAPLTSVRVKGQRHRAGESRSGVVSTRNTEFTVVSAFIRHCTVFHSKNSHPTLTTPSISRSAGHPTKPRRAASQMANNSHTQWGMSDVSTIVDSLEERMQA